MKTSIVFMLFFFTLPFSQAQPGKLDSAFGSNGFTTNDSAYIFVRPLRTMVK